MNFQLEEESDINNWFVGAINRRRRTRKDESRQTRVPRNFLHVWGQWVQTIFSLPSVCKAYFETAQHVAASWLYLVHCLLGKLPFSPWSVVLFPPERESGSDLSGMLTVSCLRLSLLPLSSFHILWSRAKVGECPDLSHWVTREKLLRKERERSSHERRQLGRDPAGKKKGKFCRSHPWIEEESALRRKVGEDKSWNLGRNANCIFNHHSWHT